jgi:divalent metal cation (Fe/Co/Zn/Cd) transporter
VFIFVAAYAVLALSLAAEGTSLLRALRQSRGEAADAGMPLHRFVPASRNPTAKAVVFEDSAAVLGVIVAAIAVGLHQATGDAAYDAAGSIVIGALLVVVSIALGRDMKGLLLGEAARPDEVAALRAAIERRAEVDEVLELLTMALGPQSLLVAVRLDLHPGIDSERVEEVSNEIDANLRAAVPGVTQVFLDATPGRGRRRTRPARIERDSE